MELPADACADEPGTLVLEVTGLGSGPDAVARHDGCVVFVPGAAPGDRVRVRIVEHHHSYLRAELVHRCSPGPAYREPPCPWAAECGGCPWQHVAYPAQLAAKARTVREALARIARVAAWQELPIIGAPDEWGYRHRIRLHAGPGGTLGYRRPRSHAVVEIGHCAIAEPLLAAVVGPLRALVPRLGVPLESIELVANGRGGVVVLAVARAPARTDVATRLARIMDAAPSVAGVELRGARERCSVGDVRVIVTPGADGPRITQRAGSFTQVNPAANRLLVQSVVTMATPETRALDLFCGAGNLSLPLACAGLAVLGVDRDRDAIADARASGAAAGLASLRFEAIAADAFLRQQGLAGADLVVLDPPRGGATSTVAQLARLRPRRIVYVSCDPATLARDVRLLGAAGYAIARVQAVDLFPQTAHVEVVLEAVSTLARGAGLTAR